MFKTTDGDLSQLLKEELTRQQQGLEMIASENYVSKAVMEASANVFMNKYSEGYPGNRYYGGQEVVDRLEMLTQYRALKMFELVDIRLPKVTDEKFNEAAKRTLENAVWGVNVQPLSGGPANLAVYLGVLKPRDTVLAMDLSSGGHLSHGHPLNASGSHYRFVSYGVNPQTHLIDYDEILKKALEQKPKMIIAGFSAYSRNIQRKNFLDIALKVEKAHKYRPILMADISHIAGLIAGRVIDGPFKYFDIVTTTTHKTLRGPRGALIYTRKCEEPSEGKRTPKLLGGKPTVRRNGFDFDLTRSVNKGLFPGIQGGPHVQTYVAKSVAFDEVMSADFRNYADQVVRNAKQLAAELTELGWNIVTGGTDNHMFLIDVTSKKHKVIDETKQVRSKKLKMATIEQPTGLTGKVAESLLESAGITCNKNMIPFDKLSPADPSGIRLGTAAITTRGFGKKEISILAIIIDRALSSKDDTKLIAECATAVKQLCKKFPLDY